MQRDFTTLLFFSFAVLAMACISGWGLTGKLAGEASGMMFLKLSIVMAIVIFAAQVLVCFLADSRTFHEMAYMAVLTLSLIWFVLSLFLPIMWLREIQVTHKAILACILLFLCIVNFMKAFRQFEKKWVAVGSKAVQQSRSRGPASWHKVVLKMHLDIDPYIPGVPRRIASVLPIFMVVSMIFGLNLRNSWPVFSAFAWGIPAALCVSIFFQTMGYNVAQARKVRSLEKELGIVFRS